MSRAKPRETDDPRTSLFQRVDTWIFDLDDTLYPRSSGLYSRMASRVVLLIQKLTGADAETAERIHEEYYERYGTSLIGLQRHHGLAPADFLSFVHQVDLDCIGTGARLRPHIAKLPGRRIVFTNGSRAHADRVLAQLALADLFTEVCDIEACGFVGKPDRVAYETLLTRHDIEPSHAMIFDDRAANLSIPFELGMKTVLVAPKLERPLHVHACVEDLADFLAAACPSDGPAEFAIAGDPVTTELLRCV